jgi:hypothetical protein
MMQFFSRLQWTNFVTDGTEGASSSKGRSRGKSYESCLEGYSKPLRNGKVLRTGAFRLIARYGR